MQRNKNQLDFFNKANRNHLNIVSYIRIHQILNRYTMLKEPFKYFLSYQDFFELPALKKVNYFVYTKELFFHIQENRINFLFRRSDLKRIDVIINTASNSFAINSYYKRRGHRISRKSSSRNTLSRKTLSRNTLSRNTISRNTFSRNTLSRNTLSNCTIAMDNFTCEDHPSGESSLKHNTCASNELIENKNIICLLNAELALTKRNEIINLNKNTNEQDISIKITIRNNMNVMENVYYSPTKFFRSFSKMQKRFNNIYLPLSKSGNNEPKCSTAKCHGGKKDTQTGRDSSGKRNRGCLGTIWCVVKSFFACLFLFLCCLRRPKGSASRPKGSGAHQKKGPQQTNETSKEEEGQQRNKKVRSKDYKKMAPKHISFKLHFDDFQTCLNIFECLCRFVNNN